MHGSTKVFLIFRPPEGIMTPSLSKEDEKSAEKPTEKTSGEIEEIIGSNVIPCYRDYHLSLFSLFPGSGQCEEPLFTKLCSPAHRRTAALAILSAQSSMDESSSSLASRSRSVSPLRSKQHNALLIGLSTGMFDANNPKVITVGTTVCF